MPRRLPRARRPISASLFTIHTTSVGRLPGRQLVALFCGLALAAANGGALAQDPPAADPLTDDPPAESTGGVTLDVAPVSVTANRTPTPLDAVGASVTVITREQIEAQQVRQLSDVLR